MDLEQPTKNLPLLWKVYDHIEAHPEEWDQSWWATRSTTADCGTAFCFAGHTVMMTHSATPFFSDPASPGACSSWVKIDDEMHMISEIAQEDLGITDSEAFVLFRATNTLADIHTLLSGWERADQESWLAAH